MLVVWLLNHLGRARRSPAVSVCLVPLLQLCIQVSQAPAKSFTDAFSGQNSVNTAKLWTDGRHITKLFNMKMGSDRMPTRPMSIGWLPTGLYKYDNDKNCQSDMPNP